MVKNIRRRRGDRWVLRIGDRDLYSLAGVPFAGDAGRSVAEAVAEAIELAVAGGISLDAAIDRFAGSRPADRVPAAFNRFCDHIDSLAQAGERSEKTAREYRRIGRNEISRYFTSTNIRELDYAAFEDWDSSLRERGLAIKSRANYLGALRACTSWLLRRRELRTPIVFPLAKSSERIPKIITRTRFLEIVADLDPLAQGPVLCMGMMGVRPGEARALEVADVDKSGDPWRLEVRHAMQGPTSGAKVGPTKTRRVRVIPIHPALRIWLEDHVDWPGRLTRAPLFAMESGKRWSHGALYKRWRKARGNSVSLNEGTKHQFASHAVSEAGSDLDRVREMLGHTDAKSTRIYAKFAPSALDVFNDR